MNIEYTDNKEHASHIAYCAYQRFGPPPNTEGEFAMYSHDRFAKLIIQGIAEKMLIDGCTEQQIKELLASKHIRWMLDSKESDLILLGMKLANNHNLSEIAKAGV